MRVACRQVPPTGSSVGELALQLFPHSERPLRHLLSIGVPAQIAQKKSEVVVPARQCAAMVGSLVPIGGEFLLHGERLAKDLLRLVPAAEIAEDLPEIGAAVGEFPLMGHDAGK